MIDCDTKRDTYIQDEAIKKFARKARLAISFHIYPSDIITLKIGGKIHLLDGIETLAKRDDEDRSTFIRRILSEHIRDHYPGNPGLPLTHWTKGEPLSKAADEKLRRKPERRFRSGLYGGRTEETN